MTGNLIELRLIATVQLSSTDILCNRVFVGIENGGYILSAG